MTIKLKYCEICYKKIKVKYISRKPINSDEGKNYENFWFCNTCFKKVINFNKFVKYEKTIKPNNRYIIGNL